MSNILNLKRKISDKIYDKASDHIFRNKASKRIFRGLYGNQTLHHKAQEKISSQVMIQVYIIQSRTSWALLCAGYKG